MSERKESDFLKRIEQLLKRTGGKDSNCKHTLDFHLNVLLYSNTEDEIETRLELCHYLLSKLFFDKMELYPTQPFKCQMDEYSDKKSTEMKNIATSIGEIRKNSFDWPLSPLPSELFGSKKQEDKDKILWFYNSLKVGDVLDCRVTQSPIDQYNLRVIHKYGVTRLLDEQHMVFLRPAKNEIKILEKPLLPSEFVRVAVCQIVENEDVVESVYVTVDVTKFEESSNFRSMPKLGRITADDIPSYVFETPDTERFSSYSDYLMSKPQFYNPHFYSGLIERCGIDPRTVCSYFPEYNRKPCNEGKTGQVLLKEYKLEDTKLLAESALKSLSRKQYDDGLKRLKNAMDLCPENAMMGKLYEFRSNIYAEQMKTSQNLKSLCDLEMAFKLAHEDDSIKENLLHKIFKAANSCYRLKQYKKAVLGFEFVLKHDETHRFAAKALDHIKTKHADQLLKFEEMSRIDLQEKKRELLTELKKINTL